MPIQHRYELRATIDDDQFVLYDTSRRRQPTARQILALCNAHESLRRRVARLQRILAARDSAEPTPKPARKRKRKGAETTTKRTRALHLPGGDK